MFGGLLDNPILGLASGAGNILRGLSFLMNRPTLPNTQGFIRRQPGQTPPRMSLTPNARSSIGGQAPVRAGSLTLEDVQNQYVEGAGAEADAMRRTRSNQEAGVEEVRKATSTEAGKLESQANRPSGALRQTESDIRMAQTGIQHQQSVIQANAKATIEDARSLLAQHRGAINAAFAKLDTAFGTAKSDMLDTTANQILRSVDAMNSRLDDLNASKEELIAQGVRPEVAEAIRMEGQVRLGEEADMTVRDVQSKYVEERNKLHTDYMANSSAISQMALSTGAQMREATLGAMKGAREESTRQIGNLQALNASLVSEARLAREYDQTTRTQLRLQASSLRVNGAFDVADRMERFVETYVNLGPITHMLWESRVDMELARYGLEMQQAGATANAYGSIGQGFGDMASMEMAQQQQSDANRASVRAQRGAIIGGAGRAAAGFFTGGMGATTGGMGPAVNSGFAGTNPNLPLGNAGNWM